MEQIGKSLATNWGIPGTDKLLPEDQRFSLEETPDLTGKVAVVTGGSQGIGYGCTRTLLSHNIAKLFILSLSEGKIQESLKAIGEEMGEDAAKKVVWLQCDLSDWKKTTEVAEDIAKNTDRLDILINNSARGVMTYQLTDYGVDRHMALNHFGHVVLTTFLLPIMKKTASEGNEVRIVNVSSNAEVAAPADTKFASLDELNRDIGPIPLYGRSKLANILYSRYLTKKLHSEYPNIFINATYPGFVDTKMSSDDIHEPYPLGGYLMSAAIKPLKKDYLQGAVSSIYLATKSTKSGEYILPPAVPDPGTPKSQDEALGERLMSLTREVIENKTGWRQFQDF